LALTGRIGDGWVPSMPYVPPAKAIDSMAIIDAAAVEAGREPSAIRRIYNLGGDISPVQEAPYSPTDTQIAGPVDHWIEVMSHLATDVGFDTFVFWGTPSRALLRLYIEEIAPGVRDRVATIRRERGTAS
jgi:alkanesulfonate monooxygenase SsuD/methylene tetrahydromethanopterin reductase-like flavin-dependent oxidoreductase (luciferase family)